MDKLHHKIGKVLYYLLQGGQIRVEGRWYSLSESNHLMVLNNKDSESGMQIDTTTPSLLSLLGKVSDDDFAIMCAEAAVHKNNRTRY